MHDGRIIVNVKSFVTRQFPMLDLLYFRSTGRRLKKYWTTKTTS